MTDELDQEQNTLPLSSLKSINVYSIRGTRAMSAHLGTLSQALARATSVTINVHVLAWEIGFSGRVKP